MRDNKEMKLNRNRKAVAVVIALTLISGVGLALPASAADARYITISATGTTTVVPNSVRINATVSVLGSTSKGALSTAGATSTAVRSALTANKVATKDIATQSITVYPEYSYPASGTPKHIRVFDVHSGKLANGRVFAQIDKGGPDGIRCDSEGRLWSSAGDGVHIFADSGELIGKILTPESPANLAFGGPELQTLFITARKSLYSLPVLAKGLR